MIAEMPFNPVAELQASLVARHRQLLINNDSRSATGRQADYPSSGQRCVRTASSSRLAAGCRSIGVLRAYPNNPEQRNVMMAQTK